MDCVQATGRIRKRKAENQDNNDRLSKRLSLLNLERNGQKLYVPVERPPTPPKTKTLLQQSAIDDDAMRLDDTKHKVYIYDLDAELSDSESSDDGRLVFLPDIQKHLRETRIPPMMLANREGELAGQKQLVLYSVPMSLTVPEEKDSVRKAIIEARARARAKTQEEHGRSEVMNIGTESLQLNGTGSAERGMDARDWYHGRGNDVPGFTNGQAFAPQVFAPIVEEPQMEEPLMDDDPDAMDLG